MTITDEKILQAIKDIEATSRRAVDCGYSWPLIKDALTELMELRAANTWQPIETCKKEKGKPILLLDVEGVIDIGWWNNNYKNRDGYIISPTHWKPLPQPPAQKEGV